MTSELIIELQQRIDELIEMGNKNPEAFHNSVMHGIMIGLQEAQEIIIKWDEVKNDRA